MTQDSFLSILIPFFNEIGQRQTPNPQIVFSAAQPQFLFDFNKNGTKMLRKLIVILGI